MFRTLLVCHSYVTRMYWCGVLAWSRFLSGPMNLSDNLYGELHPEFEGQNKDTTDIFFIFVFIYNLLFLSS